MGFSEGCTGVAQGLHRGRRGSAQRAHREHAVPILPNFFAFQAREMKFGEQNGIMTSESFQIFGGTRSFTNSLSWVRLRGPVIQANGRLTFEDDLRSGGLLCFISMNASVRTELADSMVTPGEPGGD